MGDSNKANVIVFWSEKCPMCSRIKHQLVTILDNFEHYNIGLYITVESPKIDITKLEELLENPKLKGLIFHDYEKLASKYFKASVTPEFFFVDNRGQILCCGLIDNLYTNIVSHKSIATQSYLSQAVNEWVKGKEISIKRTQAIGCFIE
jgi:thioredoxin-related protein